MLTAPRPCRGRLVISLCMVATGRVVSAAVAGGYLTCSTDPETATASPVTQSLSSLSPNLTLIRLCSFHCKANLSAPWKNPLA